VADRFIVELKLQIALAQELAHEEVPYSDGMIRQFAEHRVAQRFKKSRVPEIRTYPGTPTDDLCRAFSFRLLHKLAAKSSAAQLLGQEQELDETPLACRAPQSSPIVDPVEGSRSNTASGLSFDGPARASLEATSPRKICSRSFDWRCRGRFSASRLTCNYGDRAHITLCDTSRGMRIGSWRLQLALAVFKCRRAINGT
jgi:hypothetical protein